jgi:para-nitrobenzyl esterase
MYSVVETRGGRLRGHFRDGIYSFKGVRFAAPPFGANRLRPPQPVEPWKDVRDALTFGPKSPLKSLIRRVSPRASQNWSVRARTA